jgi:hypothetical protein
MTTPCKATVSNVQSVAEFTKSYVVSFSSALCEKTGCGSAERDGKYDPIKELFI